MRGRPRGAATTGAAVTVGPMSLLAAATSDQGGITGWLLDLVDTLGAVGVGLSILLADERDQA